MVPAITLYPNLMKLSRLFTNFICWESEDRPTGHPTICFNSNVPKMRHLFYYYPVIFFIRSKYYLDLPTSFIHVKINLKKKHLKV